jgi:serine/threonine kinase 32
MGNLCSQSSAAHGSNGSVSVKNFEIERVVGKGGFGKVNCVKKRVGDDKGTYYAMKTIWKKEGFRSASAEDMLFNERTILQHVNHPRLVNMIYAFQDKYCCYLVLDLALGGDLEYQRGTRAGKAFDEDTSRFYIAQLLLALEYVHGLNVLHRDVKPENLVLGANGYIKLTDFGISKYMNSNRRCNARSGTSVYMAPEITSKVVGVDGATIGHGMAADLYATGITLFIFVTGVLPIPARPRSKKKPGVTDDERRSSQLGKMEKKETTQTIVHDTLNQSAELSQECKELIVRLIDCNENIRMMKGAPHEDLEDKGAHTRLRHHPWLASFDWQGLKDMSMQATFLPDTSRANCNTGHDDASDTLLGGGDIEAPSLTSAQKQRLETYDFNAFVPTEEDKENPRATAYRPNQVAPK